VDCRLAWCHQGFCAATTAAAAAAAGRRAATKALLADDDDAETTLLCYFRRRLLPSVFATLLKYPSSRMTRIDCCNSPLSCSGHTISAILIAAIIICLIITEVYSHKNAAGAQIQVIKK